MIESGKFAFFQNLGMQSRNTIRGMGKMDIHMCHMHDLILVNDGKRSIIGTAFCKNIQFFDDRHKLRNNGIEIMTRPFFQSFCENRVVGVSTGFCYDLDCFIKIDSMLTEEADQFRDDHARMCVVDLNCCIIRKVMVIASTVSAFFKNQLSTCRNHEILLIDTKQTAIFI